MYPGLETLTPLQLDKYIVALDKKGNQFYGTPKGYRATYLPLQVMLDLGSGGIKRIVWASFGGDPEHWFFAYEAGNCDSYHHRLSKNAPQALHSFISTLDRSHLASLRVQFGNNGSFVAWSGKMWTASPNLAICARLKMISLATRTESNVTMGSLQSGTLDNVQWHQDGSWYINLSNGHHMGRFEGPIMRQAWAAVWQGVAPEDLKVKLQNELAYVAINPHAATGDSFVLLKKQQVGIEPYFVLRLDDGILHSNLQASVVPSLSLQRVKVPTDGSGKDFWATSKKTGRPHMNDTWELKLQKGERVKIQKDIGRQWFLAEDKRGMKGYVHGSWLEFADLKFHADSKSAYHHFQSDIQQLLVPGQMCDFFDMKSYIDSCTQRPCQILKENINSLGICVHDLSILLQGSGTYSRNWLKENRNLWHPDRFTKFCHPEQAERLKSLAQQMFVFYGILMDRASE